MLLQRRRDTGQWALPMGKMELGETPSQCAIRETREETGVLVAPGDLYGPAGARHVRLALTLTDTQVEHMIEGLDREGLDRKGGA